MPLSSELTVCVSRTDASPGVLEENLKVYGRTIGRGHASAQMTFDLVQNFTAITERLKDDTSPEEIRPVVIQITKIGGLARVQTADTVETFRRTSIASVRYYIRFHIFSRPTSQSSILLMPHWEMPTTTTTSSAWRYTLSKTVSRSTSSGGHISRNLYQNKRTGAMWVCRCLL